MTIAYPDTRSARCFVAENAIARRFFTHAGPGVQVGAVLLAGGARVVAAVGGGGFGMVDVCLALALVLAMPFAEWALHAGLLHRPPMRIGGGQLTFAVTRAHAAHHADPHDESLVVTPVRVLLLPIPFAGALVVLLPDWLRPAALTAMTVLALLLLVTEWTHYLTHVAIRPRSRWLQRRVRAHRLHHFRSDRYWFGLTSGLADAVFGTGPSRDAVCARRRQRGRSRTTSLGSLSSRNPW